MRSLHIAATGMLAQQTNVEVISNNIANLSTTGFGSTSSDTGTIVPSGVQLGLGVKTAAVYRISEQGNLSQTDNRFDLAIRGPGYFQIELPSGETAYTRDGTFGLSPQGEIVTADGFRVLPGVQIPNQARDVTINANGEVLVKLDGQAALQNVGQIQTAIFANEAGLEAIGDNLFLETPASGEVQAGVPGAPGFGNIMQGFVETSNVNVVSEITSLITAQRAYEMNSKVITASDEMLSTLARLR